MLHCIFFLLLIFILPLFPVFRIPWTGSRVYEGKTERIHYVAAEHSERWADPEEKVRAEFWAELICKYDYKPGRIGFEVKVPRRRCEAARRLRSEAEVGWQAAKRWFEGQLLGGVK